MAGIGIVNNPRSRRNIRHPETARRLRRLLDGEGEVADASTPEELERVVERFRRSGVEVLGVNGGDGTGHKVLTAFAEAYRGAPLPRLALLRGGAMNIVACAHGLRGPPEKALRPIVERYRHGLPYRVVERDLLRVTADGGVPLYGFLFGTGCVVTFLDAYYEAENPSAGRAALLLARAAGSAVAGGPFAESLTRRDPARVVADGEEWPAETFLSVIAGAIPEMGFGFKPFARCEEQPGFFHAVGITGSAVQVVLALPRIWLGRPWRRRLALDSVAREVVIETTVPLRFTVDGDLYRAEREVRVATGPGVGIIVEKGD